MQPHAGTCEKLVRHRQPELGCTPANPERQAPKIRADHGSGFSGSRGSHQFPHASNPGAPTGSQAPRGVIPPKGQEPVGSTQRNQQMLTGSGTGGETRSDLRVMLYALRVSCSQGHLASPRNPLRASPATRRHLRTSSDARGFLRRPMRPERICQSWVACRVAFGPWQTRSKSLGAPSHVGDHEASL